MTQTWYEFYRPRMNQEYTDYFRDKYFEFVCEIRDAVFHGLEHQVSAEFGCGTGLVTKVLNDWGIRPYKYFLIDSCPKMLDLAREQTEKLSVDIKFLQHDIRRPLLLPKLDVAYGHGVLEHFSDEEIRRIVGNQRVLAKKVIHYVPSNKYETPSFGDERLMTPKEWLKICQPHDIVEFNEGKDLILIWSK